MELKESFTMTVTPTAKEGSTLHFTEKIGNVTISSPNKFLPQQQFDMMVKAMNEITMNVDADEHGQLLKTEVTTDNPMAKMMGSMMMASNAGFMGTSYPAQAVSVGSTWTKQLDFGKMLESLGGMFKSDQAAQKIPVNFKVTNLDSSGGKTVVTIALSTDDDLTLQPTGQAASAGPITLHVNVQGESKVDTSDGMPISTTTHGTNTVTSGGKSSQQDVTTTLTRK